jgi:hypothetical protein
MRIDASTIMTMSNLAERTTEEWFHEAERTYMENHQGCPWCEGSHRVFCQRRGSTVIFYCQGCDFQASHDPTTDSFKMLPGIDELLETIPDTVCGVPKTLT